ncbi:hypothetical protein GOODEAATRI_009708 [Goodea atripinnis]|uniref:RNA helicase n=1 Tax=Goodea atripinnis TaxID=208336 RepID=A0ABV0MHH2_9TELE
MSVNRTLYLFSRLQRHFNTRTAHITAGSCRVLSGSRLLFQHLLPGSVVCCRVVSSNSSPPKTPDTSLFVPVSLKTDVPADGTVGAELTQPLDKTFISFRKYVLEMTSLPADLHIILSDICRNAGHIDDIYPYFMRHAKQIFPMLDCMDDLRKISDLRVPANWYPEARAIQRKVVFHAGPTNSGKTYHAIQRYLAAKSGVYCGPLKLLAHEIFEKSNSAGVPCDLVTGEERTFVDPEGRAAGHVACTIEMCSVNTPCLCAEEIHVCGEAAAVDFIRELMYTTGEEVECGVHRLTLLPHHLLSPQVHTYQRLTPFSVLDHAVESLDNLRPGDCIVCFSKIDIYSLSRQIEARGLECAVIYGSLPPGTKLSQAKKFNDPGDACKILVATDAIGMGLNLWRRSAHHRPYRLLVVQGGQFVSFSVSPNLGGLKVDGLYFVCNIDDFKFLADMIQHIPLNLRSRYVFCTAPINKKQPFVCTSFLKVTHLLYLDFCAGVLFKERSPI